MKRLYEIVDALEKQIANCESDPLPKVHLSLCEHLTLVNSEKQKEYCNKILNDPVIDPHSDIYVKAETILAANVLSQMDISAAEKIAEQALQKALVAEKDPLIIELKSLLSIIYLYNDRLPEGEAFIAECLSKAEAIEDEQTKLSVYTYAAFFFMDKDLVRSGKYAFRALELAKQSGKQWEVGYITAVLGYWATGNKIEEDEYSYFKTAAEILKAEGAEEYYAATLIQFSIAQKDRAEYEQALSTLQEAVTILSVSGNKRLQIMAYHSIARCYRAMKKYEQALSSYQEAFVLAEADNNQYELAVIHGLTGHLYRDMGELSKAIENMEKSQQLFKISNRPSNTANVSKHLHPLYLKAGDIQKAYDTLLEYTETRFKLLDENRIKETAQLQTKYESEKRESELREAKLQQTESELKAIKAQMNPHFIFNALNSIQEMFFIGDKRLANEHLGKFSQLTREILKASGKQFITLAEEMDMLNKYLELEGLRFEKDFTFTIHVSNENVVDDILIPPMLVQPYAENAIRHGLLHKKGAKNIEVHFIFDEENKLLLCHVKDNGIGRKASAEINKNRNQLHDSFSTSANAKRLELLNQNRENKIGVEYEDMANGTKVIIRIPVSYD